MWGNSSSLNCTLSSPALLGEICKLVLMVLLIVAIVLGNVVSLLVFLQARQFRTSQGYLKASLALADLAVGLIVVPYSLYREASSLASGLGQGSNTATPSLPCFITGPLFAGCTFVSITTIFLLSVERSVAVLKPLHKKAVITKRRTAWLILLSWSMSFSLAVVPMLSSPDITLQYSPCSKMCIYTFPAARLPHSPWNIMLLFAAFDFSLLGGTFAINFITFATIRQYCKARRQLGSEAPHGSRLSFSDITAAKTISILTFAFSASFSPIAVFVVGSVLGYQWCRFSFYAFWILTSNSCWNVAIYSAWDPKFRRGVRELFSRPVLNSTSQRPSRSTEGDNSAPACVAVLKEMFRPENA
ncbi:trace amine-associated receptor 4-like [Emydura macquarii macquarii]|uniref:trace amine-associated receptor 4-like n=1 Tax=Emydura macquarii macquarii TaxID=1129001 RepID=UPI00352A8460